jgi:hypothetical protein
VVLVLDTERAAERAPRERMRVRSELHRIGTLACASAQVPDGRTAQQSDGDTALLLIDAPLPVVVDDVVEALLDGIRERNAEVNPTDRIRVRVAVHSGYVLGDEHGWTGEPLGVAGELGRADRFASVLDAAGKAQAAVIVSDTVYQDVVGPGYGQVPASAYRKLVLRIAPQPLVGWVRVPGYPDPPMPPDEPTAQQVGPTGTAPAETPAGSASTHIGIQSNGSLTATNVAGGDIIIGHQRA